MGTLNASSSSQPSVSIAFELSTGGQCLISLFSGASRDHPTRGLQAACSSVPKVSSFGAEDLFSVSVPSSPLTSLLKPTFGDDIETREDIAWAEEAMVDATSTIPPTAGIGTGGDGDEGVLATREFIDALEVFLTVVTMFPVPTDVGVKAASVGLGAGPGVTLDERVVVGCPPAKEATPWLRAESYHAS